MNQKKCKNKKCQRPLPDGYKYKYCEHCRNAQVESVKKVGKGLLGVATLVTGTALTIVTKGRTKDD